MANPFLDFFSSQNSTISVNNIKANAFGNISIPLSSLPDVEITNILNSQVLSYDDLSQKWINVNASSGGASNLIDLSDVDITSIANNQGLTVLLLNGKIKRSIM